MMIRGLTLENWCCIGSLELADVPAGIVVLHGPNGTGKSSIVKAIRGCLFDFDHNSARVQDCMPWSGGGTPKVAIDFETGGGIYRITKVFSKRAEGTACLEKKRDGRWQVEENAPKEAARKTRELLGTGKSTDGLNRLLWLDQGEIALPEAGKLDGALEEKLARVLGMLVTGRDLAFKQSLDRGCERWFTPTGKDKQNSELSRLQQEKNDRQKKHEEEEAHYQKVEQAIRVMEDLQGQVPVVDQLIAESAAEVERLAAERERSQERRRHFEAAERDLRDAEHRQQQLEEQWRTYLASRTRVLDAEETSSAAEATVRLADEEKQQLERNHLVVQELLQHARRAEEAQQLDQVDLKERRALLLLSEQRARLADKLEQARQAHAGIAALERKLQELAGPDGPAIDQLRKHWRAADSLRAQLQADALNLSVLPCRRSAVDVSVDGNPARPVELPAGARQDWSFRQRVRIDVPDLGTIEVGRRQDDVDLERAARQLAELEREYGETVRAAGEVPEDGSCLDRLTERRLERDASVGRLAELRQKLQQAAPLGLQALESEAGKVENQRRLILERRPELDSWNPADDDVSARERLLQTRSAELQDARKQREREEEQAREELHKAQIHLGKCREQAIETRTTARNALAELERLGNEAALLAARQQAEHALAQARERLAQARLTEEENTVERRFLDAGNARKQRQERLHQLNGDLRERRGFLLHSEGLHTRRADAAAALAEIKESLARLQLEADAHRHLKTLFEKCRDNQVQRVMDPIAARVLHWAGDLGLNQYREVRFGDGYLPAGILRQDGNPNQPMELTDESYGIQELLNLLVRLALGGVLAKDEPVVAILDDPLAHADPHKHRRFLDILRLAADGNAAWTPPAGPLQIVVLTCHPDRFDYLACAKHIDLTSLIRRGPKSA